MTAKKLKGFDTNVNLPSKSYILQQTEGKNSQWQRYQHAAVTPDHTALHSLVPQLKMRHLRHPYNLIYN